MQINSVKMITFPTDISYPLICPWCEKETEWTGTELITYPNQFGTHRYVCINHKEDIIFTIYYNEDDKRNEINPGIQSIALMISDNMRLLYVSDGTAALQTAMFKWWLDDAEIPNRVSHLKDYNQLISKIKGYLPFL